MFFNPISTLEINSPYASPLRSVPLIITAPMSLGSHLMIIPCSFSPKTTHLFLMPRPHPTRHTSFIIHAKHTKYSLYTCQSSHNHPQPKQITREGSNIQNTARSRPASRPGWGVSLRRDISLRRASPSPRREHKNKGVAITGSRLSEIPLAWASCLLAQKLSESPGRLFVQRSPCFISPRRDWLAWARLTGIATVLHCNSQVFRSNNTCKVFSYIKTTDLTMKSTNDA